MTRRRLVALAAGTGVLLTTLPVAAAVDPGPRRLTSATEEHALALLATAAQAARELSYAGTQYIARWSDGSSDATLVELRHDPVQGSVLLQGEGGGAGVAAQGVRAVLDPRMLHLLGAAYDVEVAGEGRCTGRRATIVEARRAGVVAGRFWIDRDSGMLLRREVFDAQGRRVRSMAFVDLALLPPQPAAPAPSATPAALRPQRAVVAALREDGWHVPEQLPAGFRLFDTRRDGPVLHLAYTDGLSTLSLFAQRGRLGSAPMDGFSATTVGGRPVWVRREAPERVVWAGGGRVWTLVSDAPEPVVRSVVASLPRDPAPADGVLARFGRGLSRLGSMVNPFG